MVFRFLTFLFIITSWSFLPSFVLAQHQQHSREHSTNRRVTSEGSRGCNSPLSSIYIEENSNLEILDNNKIVVKDISPIIIYINNNGESSIDEKIIVVSLVNSKTKQTELYKEYTIKNTHKIEIIPNFTLDHNYILTANVICNHNRPSASNSLRVLLIPNNGY